MLRVRLPEALTRYVVEKGSISVEGISLTVAGIEGDEIWIAILPHTYSATNLHTLRPGMGVNHRGGCAGEVRGEPGAGGDWKARTDGGVSVGERVLGADLRR